MSARSITVGFGFPPPFSCRPFSRQPFSRPPWHRPSCLVRLSSTVIRLVVLFRFLVLLLVFIIAFGRNRRGAAARQDCDVDAGIDGAIQRRQIDAGIRRAIVGRSGEVQVLAVRIEHGIGRVAHAIRDLRRGMRGQGVQKYRVQFAFQIAAVGDPLRIGRPANLGRRAKSAAQSRCRSSQACRRATSTYQIRKCLSV